MDDEAVCYVVHDFACHGEGLYAAETLAKHDGGLWSPTEYGRRSEHAEQEGSEDYWHANTGPIAQH